MKRIDLADEAATRALGERLARTCPVRGLVFLDGDLGAGKTTLVRAFLRALGCTGAVKSPTYTLVEPYDLAGHRVLHFDLYRLADPEELEFLGVREEIDGDALVLVEWPARGQGWLPPEDLRITLDPLGAGRRATLEAPTPEGRDWLRRLTEN
ncbi:tRNA threonylcarbamoyladenosine biosynthesis protein TsaE [Ectothiorhodospira mobilis]|uniref:tRNA threonylcarbamoyladenosine biosynthesis protein TsaE n=1 Tax=Ectothiorhodospira mobilis TaxID=195064 RepID=A0A1I4QSI1_ECTMO|nr:tRNA (adenosine(37)-N6)-threonylcarbamoyltransferase complex ATPase subunit type 1 TsaE [Ectothiorhodospira mobilis]SFM42977.1 tRNA threonylcarbamoyladenosine biosynthesis protein TsaE [Ectothiorhodospira mobilis]